MTKNELIFKINETIFLINTIIKPKSNSLPSPEKIHFIDDLIKLMREGRDDNMLDALPTIKEALVNWGDHVDHQKDISSFLNDWNRMNLEGDRFFTFIDPGKHRLQAESIHSDLDKETLIKIIKHIYETSGDYNQAVHYVTPLQRDLSGLCLSLDLDDDAYFKLLKEMADLTMGRRDYYTNVTIVLFELMRRRDILKAIGE